MYNIENFSFGSALKKARKSRNLTVKELSDKIGKTTSTYYKYERDEIIIDLPTLLEICNALDMDINEFIDKEKFEDNKNMSINPFDSNLMYIYYLGFDDVTIFELEIKEDNGFQKVYFKRKNDTKIYFVGTIESSHDIAYITMKNYYATNKKFEKIQIIVNLKYASDNRYMGSISGTDDETNLPIMKKCLLTKDIISSRKDINETYERLKLSNKEKEELEKNDYFTIHFDNKNDYEVVGIEKKMQ